MRWFWVCIVFFWAHYALVFDRKGVGFERWDLNRTSKDRICTHEYIQEWAVYRRQTVWKKIFTKKRWRFSSSSTATVTVIPNIIFLFSFFSNSTGDSRPQFFILFYFCQGPPWKWYPTIFISTLSFYFLINTFYLFISRLISRYIPWANQNADASCGFVADEETVGAQYGIRFFFLRCL